jgi:hypothetical protein
MREAKVMQIFEGTNQIQRVIIARALREDSRGVLRVGGLVRETEAAHG